jgi:D-amino-acid dehydrogenase
VYDAIVVGGGLIGIVTAYHLVRRGAHVALVDRADHGRATDAGAGILAPEISLRDSSAWFQLARRSVRYYPALVDELAQAGAGETGYARCELLLAAMPDDGRELFERARRQILIREADTAVAAGTLRELSFDEARRLFPPLGRTVGTIYYRDAARVDGRLLSRAVRSVAEAGGLRVTHGSVSRLAISGRRVSGVVTDAETLEAPRVAIAGGAWSASFSEQLGLRIPIEPQRGQIIHLRSPDAETAGWPIIEGFHDHYIVPWPDGRVAVGATRETGSGFDPRVTAGGMREVLAEALRVAPGLADWEIHESRVGLRPASPDGLPVLSAVPGIEGVYLVTGHGSAGLLLGPYSGKLGAEMMLGVAPEIDLAPFSVTRFGA